jgi:hypothetical protein
VKKIQKTPTHISKQKTIFHSIESSFGGDAMGKNNNDSPNVLEAIILFFELILDILKLAFWLAWTLGIIAFLIWIL